MLAPLKNRNLIERELPADAEHAQLLADNAALKAALRLARRGQKRSATLAARKIVAQANEISRLDTLHRAARQRVEALESGQAVVELGQRLMALSAANEQLIAAAHRVWTLDKCLGAAHEECARLARERDLAMSRLDGERRCPPTRRN